MTNNQHFIVKLLSAAVMNNEIPGATTGVDWNEIYKISVEHQLFAMLYPVVKEFHGMENGPEKDLMNIWRKNTLRIAVVEATRIKEFEKVINDFDKENIKLVVLKGLVVRIFYPKPELRVMGDADILVPETQFRASQRILVKQGYIPQNNSRRCTAYEYQGIRIDLHSRLINNVVTDQVKKWEDCIWNNTIPVKIGNARAHSLSTEDHLVFLCLHMAEHFISAGFGLRQLCDLVVYVKANDASIDWDNFKNKIEIMNMRKFVQIILNICNKLFNAGIPVLNEEIVDESQIELMINNIFAGGVFGKDVAKNVVSGYYLNTLKGIQDANLPNRFVRIIYLLFPPIRIMKHKYQYVERIPILLPISWIHRILYHILRRDKVVSSKNDVKALFTSHNAFEERYKLLKWLGLI